MGTLQGAGVGVEISAVLEGGWEDNCIVLEGEVPSLLVLEGRQVKDGPGIRE